jgi:hypothetical protein
MKDWLARLRVGRRISSAKRPPTPALPTKGEGEERNKLCKKTPTPALPTGGREKKG